MILVITVVRQNDKMIISSILLPAGKRSARGSIFLTEAKKKLESRHLGSNQKLCGVKCERTYQAALTRYIRPRTCKCTFLSVYTWPVKTALSAMAFCTKQKRLAELALFLQHPRMPAAKQIEYLIKRGLTSFLYCGDLALVVMLAAS